MVTYTDAGSPADNANDETIFFGDGTSSATGCNRGGITRASRVNIGNGTNRNVYYFEHTYNAPGRYTVSFIGEFRDENISNVPSSDQRSFLIYTLITIDPTVGVNHSPVLNAPAVDRAAVGKVFLHNPAASDADGDSLAYQKVVCLYEPRGIEAILCASTNRNRPQPVVLPGYVYPNEQSVSPGSVQVAYAGPPVPQVGALAILEIDARTGQLVWNAPNTVGSYNVAFKVEEWRRMPNGSRLKIGEVLRDMQITVLATANNRPLIVVPRDTCVVAGTTITRTIEATDPDNNAIRLTAYGGIFPPATFRQTVNQAGRAEGVFTWSTNCSDVASDPKLVVFKAEDQPTSGPVLIDERPWRITVVGPAPTNLRAAAQGSTVQLTWDRYVCQNASRLLIYRKENPSTWNPSGACDVGIPASAGYVQVGTVAANLQTFLDDNAGRGLDRGKTYCYRIYAEFPRPAGGASLASREACVTLQGRAALFTNVTVDRTDATTGQITVKWTSPASSSGFNPPVGYRLFRSAAGAPFTLVRTFNSLADIVHVDPNLNTRDLTYGYRLEFFSNVSTQPNSAVLIETAGPASSVRVEATPNPGLRPSIVVRWTYSVPWNNSGSRTRIYRKDPRSTTYLLISSSATSTSTGGVYLDNDPVLRMNETYCYYVETVGGYDAPQQPQDLINRSQELCVALTQAPCRPVLTLQGPDCEALNAQAKQYPSPLPKPLTYTNNLSWALSRRPEGCNARIVEYRVLYSAQCDSSAFLEVGRTRGNSFAHPNLTSAAGCYRVLAVDSAGATAASNIVRGEDCRIFVLPNIFSPDGDQRNETFRPIFASPIVGAQVKIFNRWGAQVYSGHAGNDLTLWDGGGARSPESGGRDAGAKASAGTYFYLIEVEFADPNHTRQTYKGWLELMR
ncbi:gliding motility-associated C-terminal domain-containing protein [Hymenobacter sp. CRA2]|uniref:T9SS type B sorting domain-containing protein n=1 Tax=Hymenobacter sp. CRA2 TaxID=1955620 RepID=UPI0009CEDAF7|nr:gliding motility-associated C-terminal domain-containing protein [Hymenobacter sp. CRA2]OON69528.1 hypothetical protein B0919_08415 [Hymenobacter sp. CRA2]